MQISLLGPMRVSTDDEQPVDVGGAKQRALLAQLACRPNVAVSVDELAEGIWGTDVPSRYRQNIQVYVSTLRRVLEPGRAAKAPSRIVGHREAYELAAGPDEIDVSRFRAAAEQGREALRSGRPEAAAALLACGLTEFRGVPLVDLSDQPFAADRTTDLIEERTSALEERIAADLARGRSADVVGELQALVRDHPERERPWEQLMLALYRSGRQTEALAVYREAREALLDEAGVDPGPGLASTADRILHQDPTLLAHAPVTSESGAVPVPLTRAIGSDALLSRARTLIEDGTRLVVLTGPGGVGKTRTGLALAEELQAAGRRVVWVPLEEVGSAEVAAAEIAQRLGVTDLAADAHRLAGRTDVLLLDNLEQIPGFAAPLQRLIETVPTLQILATSRSPLAIRGERVLEVDPLEVGTDAVELFAERAASVDPTFDLATRRAATTRICRALDGLPLAIELASARMSLFSADELADLLESDGAAAAELGSDTAAGRQGSVRALVEWSLALLPANAHRLFVHLAGCPGTVDLDTATAIGEQLGLSSAECRAALTELARTALLRAVEGTVDRRFTLLNTVRSVALTDPSADPGRVLSMLAEHWVRRARLTDPIAQPGPRRVASAQAERSTTAAVVTFLIGAGRAPEAAEIVGANRRTYQVLGRADETMRMSLALLDCDLPAPARARIDVVAGSAAYACHREELSAELLAEGLAGLAADDHVYLVLGHTASCARLADRGESEPAARAAELALAYAEASSDRALIRVAHSAAGWAAIRREDFAASARHARAQLGLASDDETTMLALLDLTLAELFSEATATASATELATEAVRLAQRLGPSAPSSQAQQLLGYALLQSGDVVGGASLLVTSLRSMPANSDRGATLESVAALGLAACLLGWDSEGAVLTRRANAFALELFGVDCAVIEFLLPLAERHHVDVLLPPGSPPPLGSIADLVQIALDLGTSISSSGIQ